MEQVMSGAATPAQLAGFLVALRAKGETVDEIVGFRDAILEHARAAAGRPDGARHRRHRRRPVRHGQRVDDGGGRRRGIRRARGQARQPGGELGVGLVRRARGARHRPRARPPSGSPSVLDEAGITFAFAAAFHPGFRHAGPVRAELGVPTVFNFLGPLCNPARAEANAVGVAQLDRVPLIVGVFQTRGATALVFRGDDGLDELTTTGHSHIWEVARGDGPRARPRPARARHPARRPSTSCSGGDAAAQRRGSCTRVLGGEPGPVRDIVLLNAAAGLVVVRSSRRTGASASGRSSTRFRDKMAVAAAAIDSGAAARKLDEWVAATQRADH